ncbi:non-heme iron oxygenase ferredoxin subunit [Sphingomonas sp. AOB5]|uniref:Rieske (2Fe-2S) protein n=1 Tax=Sphingomonas sp. AOB5 TaxID=3034017 RepID=UPI0023F9AE41|nr:non-heme iron oxygenase ferredoxin subunit [Sphingomonas sp. AOB5]MDF7775610.1 non-heme iron oxygenase ferredoxin subunit [Sphingomonas sp. AOB5]
MTAPLDFTALATVSQIGEGEMIAVDAGGHAVLLARVDGEWFAASNVCTHLRARLHLGSLAGHRLACPLHGGAFDIRTGAPLCEPVRRGIEIYPVRLNGDAIEVALPREASPEPGFEW